MRITGYGVDSTPPEHSLVRQTRIGTYERLDGTAIGYDVLTRGGDSGSPVVHEGTGFVYGIHITFTCFWEDPPYYGLNYGTAIHRAELQDALAHPEGACAELVDCNLNTAPDACDLGAGEPGFTESDYLVGDGAVGVAATARDACGNDIMFDVDADGDVDLVTTNTGDDTLTIGFNDGLFGYFFTFTTISLADGGGWPYGITAGDFDGDGDVDLAVTRRGIPAKISILLNEGLDPQTGAWLGYDVQPIQTVCTKPENCKNPESIAAGDLDGDDDLDLVIGHVNTDNVSVLYNDGGAVFAPAGSPYDVGSPSAGQAYEVAIGDVDADGLLDIAVAAGQDHALVVGLNDGGYDVNLSFSNWSVQYSTGTQSNPRSVALADVNHDGYLDVVTANNGANAVGALINRGQDTGGWLGFEDPAAYPLQYAPWSLIAPDIDGDTFADVVVVHLLAAGYPDLSILINQRDGTFEVKDPFDVGDAWIAVQAAAAFLDEDDRIDLALVDYGNDKVRVLVSTTQLPTSMDYFNDGIPDECQCSSIADCNDLDSCTRDTRPGEVLCEHVFVLHPYGDVNADLALDQDDIDIVVGCFSGCCAGCLGGVYTGCDIADRPMLCVSDEVVDLEDVLAVLDAVSGNPWCPDCVCDAGGGLMASAGGGAGPGGVTEVGRGLLLVLTTQNPVDEFAYRAAVELITGWLAERMTTEQSAGLVETLQDPSLEFASPVAGEMIPEIVATLLGR